jgi:hypothetical protein
VREVRAGSEVSYRLSSMAVRMCMLACVNIFSEVIEIYSTIEISRANSPDERS